VLGAGHPVIFDLTKVEFIDSSGIGLIVHAYKTLRAKRAKVVVSGASEQPLELLKATQLDRFVPFKTNLEEARAAIT
jgi:anti-sigma B factor antagonist